VMLVDAGPLVALVNLDDQWHAECRGSWESLREQLVTVWPVITEAAHLLRRAPAGRDALLGLLEAQSVAIAPLELSDLPRMRELMRKYRDLPMDLADAALVRIAERERIRRVFTLERRDFELYRPSRLGRFEILP
jgi:uncharacterized protein